MPSVVYVPVLKGKEGEFGALEALANDVRDAIMPLVEVPGVPYDYANERPAKTLDEHVSGIADRLYRAWGRDRALYLDLPWFGAEERLADGTVALEAVLGNCAAADLRVIPVISRSSSPDYLRAAGEHARTCETGACVRLLVEDFAEDVDPAEIVERLRTGTGGVPLDQLDLVLDLEHLGADPGRDVLVARSILSLVPDIGDWRTVILASASFPEDLSEVDAATISLLPRREWALWQSMRRRPHSNRRDLVFADYAIAHPTPRELDPRTMRMSANIRYTTADGWLVIKGRNVRQYGYDQYFELCRVLTSRAEFSGPEFSWGDKFIAQCAKRESGPGNATTWRKVGTNHHLTLVARQLSS